MCWLGRVCGRGVRALGADYLLDPKHSVEDASGPSAEAALWVADYLRLGAAEGSGRRWASDHGLLRACHAGPGPRSNPNTATWRRRSQSPCARPTAAQGACRARRGRRVGRHELGGDNAARDPPLDALLQPRGAGARLSVPPARASWPRAEAVIAGSPRPGRAGAQPLPGGQGSVGTAAGAERTDLGRRDSRERVVGISAFVAGFITSAMAMTTRWRMPPESWCGYSPRAVPGRECRRARASRSPSLHASRLDMPAWMRATSPIWSPTVKTGFSAVIGSWNTIAMRLPRTRCISRSSSARRSRPSNRITLPASMRPGGRTRRRIESAVTLLPQPDSPTTPTRLADPDVERHAVDGARDAVVGVEEGVEIRRSRAGASSCL